MGSMVESERQQTLEIAPEICLKKREFFPDDIWAIENRCRVSPH
jgi:hypothetical protein